MKILYVSHLFLPVHSGGTEVYTFDVASEMRRWGHEVHVLACESFKTGKRNEVRSSDDVYRDLNVHRVYLNIMLMDDPVRSEYYNPYVEQHLIEYFGALRPDLIHAHHLCYLSTAVVTAAQKLGIPTAFTATDFWLICPDSQLLRWNGTLCDGPSNIADCLRCYTHLSKRAKKYRWLMKTLPDGLLKQMVNFSVETGPKFIWQLRVLQAANFRAEWNRKIFNSLGLFIAPSRFLESLFVQNGLTNPHRAFIPFGVRSALLDADCRKSPSEGVRFGFIGTISKHKGLHVLIEAFKGLEPSAPARLKVYGDLKFDPPYGKTICEMAAGEPRIEFLGTFPHEKMSEVLRGIDVLVVPSMWYENTPLVISSALAMETPVICTDLSGMAEVVHHGGNGLTFPMGDVNVLRERLREFLNRRELLQQLRPSRSSVQTLAENAEQLEQLYAALLHREGAVATTLHSKATSVMN